MKFRIVLVYVLFFVATSVCKISFDEISQKKAKLLSTKEMRFCYISFVDVEGTVYLVKQKRFIRKILGIVRDAITAHVAETFDLAHQVDVIPADVDFPGKVIKEWPATIHTVAPGMMIKNLDNFYKKMNIKQADIGFRRDMLYWMAKHPTLVKVVALDTFLCNHDRHRGNLFYNPKTDTFCAIDMDSSFKYNLSLLACENFTKMITNGSLFPLKRKELKVLREYRNALQDLLKAHQPEVTIAVFEDFIEKAGFVDGAPFYHKKFAMELESNKATMRQSYENIKELVKILNGIIKRAVRV